MKKTEQTHNGYTNYITWLYAMYVDCEYALVKIRERLSEKVIEKNRGIHSKGVTQELVFEEMIKLYKGIFWDCISTNEIFKLDSTDQDYKNINFEEIAISEAQESIIQYWGN